MVFAGRMRRSSDVSTEDLAHSGNEILRLKARGLLREPLVETAYVHRQRRAKCILIRSDEFGCNLRTLAAIAAARTHPGEVSGEGRRLISH
jgi:hypothetical protein